DCRHDALPISMSEELEQLLKNLKLRRILEIYEFGPPTMESTMVRNGPETLQFPRNRAVLKWPKRLIISQIDLQLSKTRKSSSRRGLASPKPGLRWSIGGAAEETGSRPGSRAPGPK